MNSNKNAIFIFTKERPSILELSISQLNSFKGDVCVIDDSYTTENIQFNKNIVLANNRIYLGKYENMKFYESIKDILYDTVIGTEEWNLGSARNFALDVSLFYHYDKVLFMDDDILFGDLDKIEYGFHITNTENFVSYKIVGLLDDSIIGHITTDLEIEDPFVRMLSGGLLFFTPSSLNFHFLNIYNEDWIIQLLEFKKDRILIDKEVIHRESNPFQNYETKVLFQEYGEIFVEGLAALPEKKIGFALSNDFWKDIIAIRKQYLKELLLKAEHKSEKEKIQILNYLESNYSLYKEHYFSNYIVQIINQNKIK